MDPSTTGPQSQRAPCAGIYKGGWSISPGSEVGENRENRRFSWLLRPTCLVLQVTATSDTAVAAAAVCADVAPAAIDVTVVTAGVPRSPLRLSLPLRPLWAALSAAARVPAPRAAECRERRRSAKFSLAAPPATSTVVAGECAATQPLR